MQESNPFDADRIPAQVNPASVSEQTVPEETWSLSADASFHAVGRRAALFDSRRQKLYAVNRSAAFFWCCLAEGYTLSQSAAAFAMRAGIAQSDAAAQLAAILRSWHACGLVARAARRGDGAAFAERADAWKTVPAPALSTGGVGPPGPPSATTTCHLLDTTFHVVFEDRSLQSTVAAVLAMVAAAEPDRAGERLDVINAGAGRVALIHRDEIRWAGPRSRLVPIVYATLVRLALERTRSYPALHAAAVRTPSGAVLFPGPAGCGKSTLVLGLMAARRNPVCDDTVVLDMESMHARPVAPVLCLKAGAWNAVEQRLARLRRQPVYRRPDGALVRFLALDRSPAGHGRPADAGQPVRAIVFPRYRAGRRTHLTPIGAPMALMRLMHCVDPIGNRLRGDDVERLIQWVRRTDCYALTVDSLDEAVDAVSNLLS